MENKYKLWIARDKSGELYAYYSKPERCNDCGIWLSNSCSFEIPRRYYPDLSWKDESLETVLTPVIKS